MSSNFVCALVIALYFATVIFLTFRGTRKSSGSDNFSEDFYVGGRKLGPIALAILVAAGACSTGTFIGGPGLSAQNGIGYSLLFAGGQICMTLFILGILGKKMNIIGRRTQAQSYVDIFRYRFDEYKPLIILLAVALLVFLISSATGEFVGGSRVIETVTGIPYMWSLIAFGVLITLYTSTGGMTGVSVVGILQGFIMTFATIVLLVGFMVYFGGMPEIMEQISQISTDLLTPNAGGTISLLNEFDLWVTYSIGIIGLPWAVQSALTYKDTKTMKRAIYIGIVLVSIWTILLCGWAGAAARAYAPDLAVSDYFIPTMSLGILPSFFAGVVLAGVAGAGQSTIASLMILGVSTIVVNLYKGIINPSASEKQIRKLSIITCAAIGIVNIILASMNPPTLQVFITFAAGGCASALLPGLVLGLYWPRCNKYGAFAGLLSGFVFYALFSLVELGIPFVNTAPLIFSAPLSFLICYAVSKMTPPPEKRVLMIYFGEMSE